MAEILFLYRTPKKKKYFESLASQALVDSNSKIVSYNRLILNLSFLKPLPETLKPCLKMGVEEVFHSRDFFGVNFLKKVYSCLLSIKIKNLYSGLHKCLTNTSPKMIVVWNGLKYQDLVLKKVLNDFPKVNTFYMENGPLPNTTMMDSEGVNAGSSLERSPKFYKELHGSSSSSSSQWADTIQGRDYKHKKTTAPEAELKEGQKYILIPFQMERDSQLLIYSPWIHSMKDLYHSVIDAYKMSELKNYSLVFREHPSTTTKYPELYEHAKESDSIFFDSETPLKTALLHAQGVVTINSSVGFEALLLEKNVISLGQAFYDIEGLTQNAASIESLSEAFNKLESFQPDEELKDKFIQYLKDDFLLEGDWKTPDKKHFQSFQQKIKRSLSHAHPSL